MEEYKYIALNTLLSLDRHQPEPAEHPEAGKVLEFTPGETRHRGGRGAERSGGGVFMLTLPHHFPPHTSLF